LLKIFTNCRVINPNYASIAFLSNCLNILKVNIISKKKVLNNNKHKSFKVWVGDN